jgi:hypothetical protein
MKLSSQFWASLLREGNPDDMENVAPAILRNSMMVFDSILQSRSKMMRNRFLNQ